MLTALAGIAKALGAKAGGSAGKLIDGAKPDAEQTALADAIKEGERAAVLLGNLAMAHADYAILRDLAAAVAAAGSASLGFLPEAANTVGARLAGPRTAVAAALVAGQGQLPHTAARDPRVARHEPAPSEPGSTRWTQNGLS